MCLAAVYAQARAEAPTELALDKVQLIEVDGAKLTCTSLFGEVVNAQGAITCVDLANSTVEIALE